MTTPDTQPAASGPTLDMFNRASPDVLQPQLTNLSGSDTWSRTLLAARPFHTLDAALIASDRALTELSRSDLALAIAAHPALGRAPQPGSTSESEQATLLGTLDVGDTTAELNRLSRDYESRFGHVFLLRARGLDAEAVLAALRGRLDNDVETEWAETVEQLRLITRARLADLINDTEAAAA